MAPFGLCAPGDQREAVGPVDEAGLRAGHRQRAEVDVRLLPSAFEVPLGPVAHDGHRRGAHLDLRDGLIPFVVSAVGVGVLPEREHVVERLQDDRIVGVPLAGEEVVVKLRSGLGDEHVFEREQIDRPRFVAAYRQWNDLVRRGGERFADREELRERRRGREPAIVEHLLVVEEGVDAVDVHRHRVHVAVVR